MKDPKRLEKYQRWREVFKSPAGQSVLSELSKMCGYEVSSFYMDINGIIDPTALAIQAGKRSVFTEIKRNLIEPQDVPEQPDDVI